MIAIAMYTDKELEEREYQLELLKAELRQNALNESYSLTLNISITLIVSLGMNFLLEGLTTGNYSYLYLAMISIESIILIIYLARRRYNQESVKEEANRIIDEELSEIREKYINSHRNMKQSENN